MGMFRNYLLDTARDWGSWFRRIKWLFASFKFLSFFSVLLVSVAFWVGLGVVFDNTVDVVTALHQKGLIDNAHVKDITVKAYDVLYDKAVGHFSVFLTGVLVAIVGAKMVSEYGEGKVRTEVAKEAAKNGKITNGDDLEKFLPKSD